MNKILMIYKIPEGNDSVRISFNREMFEYRVQSNKGKYDKKSKGILKKYKKPVRSVIIFDKDMLNKVKEICNKFKVTYELYKIEEIIS